VTATPVADATVIVVGAERLDAVVETRRIVYTGSGPLVRMLVEALEDEGVTVVVRREGAGVGQHRESRGMGEDVNATLVATGAVEAIKAGVRMFLHRSANRAQVMIEGEEPPPPPRGRHRA
jgi:hypothetical protein